MKHAKLRGPKRNAAVVLGNSGTPGEVSVLTVAPTSDEPLVRAHASWALGRLGSASVVATLCERERVEADASVLEEIRAALSKAEGWAHGPPVRAPRCSAA